MPGREPSKATTGTKPDLRALKNKPQPVAAQLSSFPLSFPGVDAVDNSGESSCLKLLWDLIARILWVLFRSSVLSKFCLFLGGLLDNNELCRGLGGKDWFFFSLLSSNFGYLGGLWRTGDKVKSERNPKKKKKSKSRGTALPHTALITINQAKINLSEFKGTFFS